MRQKENEECFWKTALCCWKEDFWLKILTLTSIGLLVAAFICPPTAVIDASVLAATGELVGFAAIWQFSKAINKNIDAKIKIHEIELEIENDEVEKAQIEQQEINLEDE
jgi:hypothetical protein